MIEKINEENVWQFLKNDNKPIMIYGMGNGAEKIISTLNDYGVQISEIFASDEFVRGHSFLGKKVLKYSEICQKYDDFNVVLAFATHIDSVLKNIKKIDNEHSVFAPDVPVAGGGLFSREFVTKHNTEFDFVFDKLEDEESKKSFVDTISFKISGKVDYLYNNFANKDEIYKNIFKLSESETIVDLGAYDGDTIREFTTYTGGKYKHIIALEPDEKTFKKLKHNTNGMQGVSLYNIGAWNKKDTLIFSKNAGRNSHLSSSGVPVNVCDIDSLINEKVTLLKWTLKAVK